MKTHFNCDVCEDKGYYPVADGPDDFVNVPCECQQLLSVDDILAHLAARGAWSEDIDRVF